MSVSPPTLEAIADARRQLGGRIRETPAWEWRGRRIEALAGASTRVFMKLELLQHAGTFKPRAALLNTMAMSDAARRRGITAVSAGNHAIAAAFAARIVGTSAKVVMPKTANPARVAQCRAFGAEVVFAEDTHEAFARVRKIEQEESRTFIHPFDGERTVLGCATVGYEWCRQVEGLEAVVVPIGGGGLCAGIASAVKQMQPDCLVFGVEPEGADTMHRSFAAGSPQAIDRIDTIADSLGAPYAGELAFELCRRYVDGLVKVGDEDLRRAMGLVFAELKFAVEPAAAAATAALVGPLRDRLFGKRVGVIICGSNIDLPTFSRLALPFEPEPAV